MSDKVNLLDAKVSVVVDLVTKMAAKIDALNTQVGTPPVLSPEDDAKITADASALDTAIALGTSKL